MAAIQLGFGHSEQTLVVGEEHLLAILEGKSTPAVEDVPRALKHALNNPIGTASLKTLVKAGESICIIVSDATRGWIGYAQFLPCLLDELNAAGIVDADITLLIALGAHRPHTEQEHLETYGKEVVRRVRIEQSNAQVADDFVYMGTTSFGTDAYLNKHAVNADKVILTGGIVYHSMAGFGGGRKGIVPGISRYSTIQQNHSLCLAAEPGAGIASYVASGRTSDNCMHQDLMEIAAMLNPAFLINAMPAPNGGYAGFVAGHWEKAWRAGCETVAAIYGVAIEQKADIVVASAGGMPKDVNLYQGTKAMDNAVMAVKDDGAVILVLECADINEPPDFSQWFEISSLVDRENKLRGGFTVPGFVALKCGYDLRRIPHIIVTKPDNKQFVEKSSFIYAQDVNAAFALARQIVNRKDYTVIVMPDGANTVPHLQSC